MPPSTIGTSETTFLASAAFTSIQTPTSGAVSTLSPLVTNPPDATTADGKAPDIDAVAPATEVPVTTVTNGNAATTNAPANDAVASIDQSITSATNTATIPATNAVTNTAEAFIQTNEETDQIKTSPDGLGEVVTDLVTDLVTDARTVTTTVVPPTSYPASLTNSPAIGLEATVPKSQSTVLAAAPQPELDVKADGRPLTGAEEKSEGLSAETEEKKTPNSENKDKAAEAPGITISHF